MKNLVSPTLWNAFGLAWLAFGCAGEAVDLGPGPTSPEMSLAGTWRATLTSGALASSPKPLRLELDATGNGTLLVGDAELPLPTDPSIGFPPEAEIDAAEATGQRVHLYDGVSYTLGSVHASGGHLSADIDALQSFGPFCAIQAPLMTTSGYHCLENSGGGVDRSSGTKQCYLQDENAPNLQGASVDCVRLMLCSISFSPACRCTDSTCSVYADSPIHDTLELSVSADGTTLGGTLEYAPARPEDGSGPSSVTFTREVN